MSMNLCVASVTCLHNCKVMIKLLFMIERGMLTSNRTSQNATSPAQKHWANNEGMLASTFDCFFGIPSKHLLLASSTLKACIPRICHAAGIPALFVLLSGGSRKKTSHPKDDAMGERETSTKIKLEADPIGGFIAPIWKQHLCNVNFPAQIGAIVGCWIGGFKLRKGGPFWKI